MEDQIAEKYSFLQETIELVSGVTLTLSTLYQTIPLHNYISRIYRGECRFNMRPRFHKVTQF